MRKIICCGLPVIRKNIMSNLAANEMFSREQPVDRETVIAKILQGMEGLRKQADPLVIVTNNVFEDGIAYDSATIEYIEALGRVNERLAAEADEVVEVVAGIPQRIKAYPISIERKQACVLSNLFS